MPPITTTIAEVRELAKGAAGFAHVDVIEALANKGLAASVIDGVTHACVICSRAHHRGGG